MLYLFYYQLDIGCSESEIELVVIDYYFLLVKFLFKIVISVNLFFKVLILENLDILLVEIKYLLIYRLAVRFFWKM